MKEKLASTEAEASTTDNVDEIVSGCVGKRSLVVSGVKRARRGQNANGEGTSRLQVNDDIQAILETNKSELEALAARIDGEVAKNQDYETKLQTAEKEIESQKVVIREQEGIIFSLQSEVQSTKNDVAEVKSDLNAIYRVLFQKQTSGSGKLNF